MARKTNIATNLLGRFVVPVIEDEARSKRYAEIAPDLPISKVLNAGVAVEVVTVFREDDSTWLNVSTPQGIVPIRADQVKLAPEVTA